VKSLKSSAALVVVVLFVAVSGLAPVAQAQAPGSGATEVGSSDWRQVSAGFSHTCGIRSSGRLYCWGSDEYGRLGNGGADSNASTPVQVAGGATNWASVTAGSYHTCALRTTGRLYCWGRDANGQLGDNATLANQPTPVEVSVA